MNCRQARELLPVYVDNELTADQRGAMEGHLASCPECRRLLSLHQRLPGMLAQLPAPDSLLETNVTRRVQAAVARERRGGSWWRGATLAARATAALITLALLGSLLYVGVYLAASRDQWAARPAPPAVAPTARPKPDAPKPPVVALPPSLGKLALVRAGDVWVKELPDGQEQRLTQDGRNSEPKWSPSGNWLAFHKDKRLWLVSASGAEVQEVGQRDVSHFAWSSAGDQLAYAAEGILYATSPGGSAPRQLVAPQEIKTGNGVSSFAWSPDGTWLAYANGAVLQPAQGGQPSQRYEFLGAIRPDGTDGHMIVDAGNPTQSYFVVAGWSPDSRKVLFWFSPTASASIQADGLSLNAVSVDAITTDLKKDVRADKVVTQMLTYPDFLAGTLYYNSLAVTTGPGRESWTKKRIAVVDLNSGKLVEITDQTAALTPDWSPDGQRIVYVSGPDVGPVGGGNEAKAALNQRRIWMMNRDGSDKRQLTVEEGYRDELPRFSSDGATILFARFHGDTIQLWTMRQEGGDQRLVADNLGLGPSAGPQTDAWFGYYGHIDWEQSYDWWTPSSMPVRSPAPVTTKAPPTPQPQATQRRRQRSPPLRPV